MSWNESSLRRWTVCALATLAALAVSATMTASASAVPAHGSAVVALANHAKGRTLSGQGVKVVATAPASLTGTQLTVPVSAVELGSKPGAHLSGGFSFAANGRSVAVASPRIDVAAGALVGIVGGAEVQIFRLGAPVGVNAGAGSISLQNGRLRLVGDFAAQLRQKLGLERALVNRGVGMIWVAGQANPLQHHRKLTSGTLTWDFLTSFREYIYKELGPGSVGSIVTEGGASTTGNPAVAGSFFSFPLSSGTFVEGLYGASSEMTVNTTGSVKFAKPGHCINEIKFTNIVVHLGGATPSLVADLSYNVGQIAGKSCVPQPPVSAPGTTIATLNTSGISPAISGGNTVTWANVGATLSPAAAKPFEPNYKAGQQLDPITVTAAIG
jgi:hypothetical protein